MIKVKLRAQKKLALSPDLPKEFREMTIQAITDNRFPIKEHKVLPFELAKSLDQFLKTVPSRQIEKILLT